MSFNYYKKVNAAPVQNSYGFKQVSSRELNDILKRVTRPTYSARLHTEEQRQLNNYEYLLNENGGRRNLASACSKRTNSRMSSATESSAQDKQSKRYTEREMSRLLRRLQRPTTATSAHVYHNEEVENLKQGKIVRAKSADPEKLAKSVAKLRRPTTATLAKGLDTCHLCYEHENRKEAEEPDAFDYEYGDSKVVPSEEMDFIVERVSAPTVASIGGKRYCRKLPEYIDEVKIRSDLPLLSGLRRSRNVNEITKRLFPSRRHHGHVPQATPIMTY